jgi:flavodoxin
MLNTILISFMAFVLIIPLAFAQEHNHKPPTKTLVIFFSVTGTTRELAEQVHSHVGGDIIELTPAIPYPTDYSSTVARHRQEQKSSALPEISTVIDNMNDYDTIFIGYPIWSGTIPRIMEAFLRQYDLSGKTIAPFSTHGGGGPGRSVQDIRALCPDSTVVNGLSMTGGGISNSRNDIANWLKNSGFTQH